MIGLRPAFDVYSIALLTSMLLTGAGLALMLAHAADRSRRLMPAAGKLCLVALGFGVFALSFHFRLGHPAGSAEALSALAFIGAHPALSLVVALAAVFAWVARRAEGR